jgi:hypothetical protein
MRTKLRLQIRRNYSNSPLCDSLTDLDAFAQQHARDSMEMTKSLPSNFIENWLVQKGVELHGPKDLVEKAKQFCHNKERTKSVLEQIQNGFETNTLGFRLVLA